MTEPTYTFVKGKGWIVQTHEEHVFELEGHKIVLARRTPEIGEHFYIESASTSFKSVEENLKSSYWRGQIIAGTAYANIACWSERSRINTAQKYVVIKIEKL